MQIRPMHRNELELALDWAAAEGWNPGLSDAACFHAADPEGFLVGLVDGVPAASIFAVKYGASFAFIGGYIVTPALRGQGHGRALWDAAMAGLAGRNVGLDGVLTQQANYARSGFRLAYRNIRFEGEGSGQAGADERIVTLSASDLDAVARYDRLCFPEQRAGFLACWLGQPQHVALGARGAHGLAGYAVLRPCRAGYKVGPLFADTPAVAAALFAALQGKVARGVALYLDVPEPNAAALALAADARMRPCFETARMYTGEAPALALARQFGVTTFELG